MGTTMLIVSGLASAALAAVAVLALLLIHERRRTARLLDRGRTESTTLQARINELEVRMSGVSAASAAVTPRVAEFLITDVGQPQPVPQVPDRLVLSATVGAPLVKVAALSYGVRRALSAESRNRIWFEMRREVRRARKQRRQEMRQAWRSVRAGRGVEDPA